ncbi:MAG: hypothetical protein CVU42_06090 [Chloroflexi bacterium HGW-Chloroflexi-4]|jgi:hypothetical protein|nr:MAG: hypothetical protein CVU45_04600 [Chloroflexi bacterium HGW-Chloroflexi-7]PKN99917.1 MAG: hypothetical protein CVU42_06090 [Chloroflexi bacterium HGW-Chloroflexi-4]
MTTLSAAQLKQYQEKTFRTTESARLRTPQQAVDFVNERGFIFFWPVKGVTMPSLWCSVAGDRPVADAHDDPGHTSWGWKDQMLDKRVWYYGRILRKRNTIISLQTVPFFYALSPNFGEPELEISDQYHAGQIPLEVKLIFEALLVKGPLDSIALRREAHLSGPNSNTPFNRALDILQRDFKVMPTGIAEVGTWKYAFVYDLTHRYHPELLDQSRYISENQARDHLVTTFFNSVGAASDKQVQSLFGWTQPETQKSIYRLIEKGLLSNYSQIGENSIFQYCLTSLLK